MSESVFVLVREPEPDSGDNTIVGLSRGKYQIGKDCMLRTRIATGFPHWTSCAPWLMPP